jgi:hypothetical protein
MGKSWFTREPVPRGLCFKQNLLPTMMRRMIGRSAVVKAVASRSSGELATVFLFSLGGLDLSVWLFAEGLLRPSRILLNALLLLG